ncbi:unnamed protein product [Urochloa humidicola]
MAPRLPLAGALLLVVVLAVSGEGDDAHAPRLRGSVACLDCAAGHDLSGVVVAVRCAGDTGLLLAAATDALGAFDVAMPSAVAPPSSAATPTPTPCAARVLGATTEQLCAPQGLAVARVVPGPSYTLGSRLAVFVTRCGPGPASGGGGSAAAAETMDAPDRQQRRRQGDAAPRVPVVSAAPRAGGNGSPPPLGAGGGLPLILFFPFIPIIGIP